MAVMLTNVLFASLNEEKAFNINIEQKKHD